MTWSIFRGAEAQGEFIVVDHAVASGVCFVQHGIKLLHRHLHPHLHHILLEKGVGDESRAVFVQVFELSNEIIVGINVFEFVLHY